MEGVAGISRPRRRRFPGERVTSSLPPRLRFQGSFRWNTPPSVGRSKGGEVPPTSPPAFFAASMIRKNGDRFSDQIMLKELAVVLHDDAGRAMVTEGSPK